MAMSLQFKCETCGFSLDVWDDGNPYVEHPPGKRNYCYHPSLEDQINEVLDQALGPSATEDGKAAFLKEYSGNASDHLCLSCAHVSKLDKNRDKMECLKCKSPRLHETFSLTGTLCPKCKNGKFRKGTFCAIS